MTDCGVLQHERGCCGIDTFCIGGGARCFHVSACSLEYQLCLELLQDCSSIFREVTQTEEGSLSHTLCGVFDAAEQVRVHRGKEGQTSMTSSPAPLFLRRESGLFSLQYFT